MSDIEQYVEVWKIFCKIQLIYYISWDEEPNLGFLNTAQEISLGTDWFSMIFWSHLLHCISAVLLS